MRPWTGSAHNKVVSAFRGWKRCVWQWASAEGGWATLVAISGSLEVSRMNFTVRDVDHSAELFLRLGLLIGCCVFVGC